MTAGTFIVTYKKRKYIFRVSHDGHPDFTFTRPLFKVLKNSKNPDITIVLKSLISNEEPGYPIEVYTDEETACGSDYEYDINLDKRTWKCTGYKLRVF